MAEIRHTASTRLLIQSSPSNNPDVSLIRDFLAALDREGVPNRTPVNVRKMDPGMRGFQLYVDIESTKVLAPKPDVAELGDGE